MSTMNLIWLLTGVVVVVVLVMAISAAVRRGNKVPGMPKTTQYDLQDAPPADADVTTPAGQRPADSPPK